MSSILHAQLTPGSIASDFTVQAYQSWLSSAGFNGDGSYNLYDYLDSGYTVIIDVSATWCGPCWNYHTSGELEDLYANHGPSGFPGVNSTTTDDLMVIWIEGDGSTSNATMLDGAGSIGNWIEPVSGHKVQFPMANPASSLANQINSNYDIAYFPTIYKICPNRVVELVGQGTASQLYSAVLACPAPASEPNDGALLSYQGLAKSCKPIDLKVKLQNNGTTPLTSTTFSPDSEGRY